VRYLAAREIAAVCGVNPKTIRRWAAAGRLPAPVRGPDGQGRARWAAEPVAGILSAAGYRVPAEWSEVSPAPKAAA